VGYNDGMVSQILTVSIFSSRIHPAQIKVVETPCPKINLEESRVEERSLR